MLQRFLLVLGVCSAALCLALPALAAPSGPNPTSTPGSSSAAPTPDRLAAPPTVTNPSQADVGAQLFWLHCQPCHGDQAQGLTADWRAQYPPEDQDCWKSGCHGSHPYHNGFTLPQNVPALIGAGTLNRFATAADLYVFISHAMPFQAPGSLKPEEYWAITAFLMRGHGLPPSALPINDAAGAQRLPLGGPNTPATAVAPAGASGSHWPLPAAFALGAAGLAALGGGWLVWRRTRPHA